MTETLKPAEQPSRKDLEDWLRFLRADSYVLKEYPEMLWQQAANQPRQSAVAIRAAKLQAESRWTKRPWLRWINRAGGSACLMTLTGHTQMVNAVAVTPDGRRIVSGSNDCTVRVWDATDGRELLKLEGHQPSISAVAVTPDGQYIVSGSRDGTVGLWELKSGRQVRAFADQEVHAVAVTPDGRRIVASTGDDIKVWEIESGREICSISTFSEFRGEVTSVAVTPDGKRIVSGGRSGFLKVWDAEGGRELCTLSRSGAAVRAVAAMPDNRRVVSGSGDGKVKIWDLDSGTELLAMDHIEEALSMDETRAVAVTPDGRRIISAAGSKAIGASGGLSLGADLSGDRSVKIWDAESGRAIHTLEGHTASVLAVAAMPDGRRLVSGSEDGTVKVWEPEGVEQERVPRFHSEGIRAVGISPSGQWAVTIDRESAKVWHVQSNREYGTQPTSGFFYDLVVVPGGRRVIFAGSSSCKVWDTETGQELQQFAQDLDVIKVALSPDGKRVVGGDRHGNLIVWDLQSCKQLSKVKAHNSEVVSITVFPDGRRVASAGIDETSPTIWDIRSREPRRMPRGHSNGIQRLAVTPDGGFIVSSSRDKTIKCWDAARGQELFTLRGHESWVTAVAVTSGARFIISGSRDRTIRIWDFHTHEVVGRFVSAGGISCIATQGKMLAVACDTGHVYVFEMWGLDDEPRVPEKRDFPTARLPWRLLSRVWPARNKET